MDLVSLDSPARPIKQPEETTVNIFSENQCNRGSNGDTTVEGEASIRRIIFFFFFREKLEPISSRSREGFLGAPLGEKRENRRRKNSMKENVFVQRSFQQRVTILDGQTINAMSPYSPRLLRRYGGGS